MRGVTVVICFIIFSLSVVGQPLEETISVKPNPGEGIWSFLRRHDLAPQEHLERFRMLNEGKFAPDGGLYVHHHYIIPIVSTRWVEPLFGKDHQDLRLLDEELKGAVFYLVSGHGGPDPGAIGKYGDHLLYEDEYAYDITLRLAKNLMQKGAKVHVIVQDPHNGIRSGAILTPDENERVMGQVIPLDQIQRLKQRSDAINNLFRQENSDYQRCIEIHLDSRSRTHQLDVFFYYHQHSRSGKQMAETLRKTFEENYRRHQPNRGFSGTVTHRNLYMLRNTRPVAVFVELGNIMNFRDQQRFVVESNRQALANWLTAGIVEDYKNHQNNK